MASSDFKLHGTPLPPLSSFSLFQTQERFYLVGSDKNRTRFRVLKIDRNENTQLCLADSGHDYAENEVNELLRMINESSKSGISKVAAGRGLLGFVRFLEGYYLLMISKRKKVGEIAGNGIYTIESTIMIPFSSRPSVRVDEARYKSLFSAMDLSKGFFFSYSYDLTNSLQTNMGGLPKKVRGGGAWVAECANEMFTWNHYLLMLRGSIPLFWTQITDAMVPKPAIILHHFDPVHAATRAHVSQLFQRYSTPAYFLNLVKGEEKKKREVMLRDELSTALDTLNNRLPQEHQVIHCKWDFHKASKANTIMSDLANISADILSRTGLFCSHSCAAADDDQDLSKLGGFVHKIGREQRGIARTNCIDCLDRTNVAQFALGKAALGHQLHLLGLLDSTELDRDCELALSLMNMFEQLGDQIALQYVGSVAHAKMEKDKKDHGSKMKKLMVTLNRYYKNTFTDAEKQNSIDLFLGNFIPSNGRLHLWDLEAHDADYYLHNAELTPLLSQLKFIGDFHWWKTALDAFYGSTPRPTLSSLPPPDHDANEEIDPRLLYWRNRRDLLFRDEDDGQFEVGQRIEFQMPESENNNNNNNNETAAVEAENNGETTAAVTGGGGAAAKEGEENEEDGENGKSGEKEVDMGVEPSLRMTSFEKYLSAPFRQAINISVYAQDSQRATPSRAIVQRSKAAWMNLKRTLFSKNAMLLPRQADEQGGRFDGRFASNPQSETIATEAFMKRYLNLAGVDEFGELNFPDELVQYVQNEHVYESLSEKSERIYTSCVTHGYETSEDTVSSFVSYMDLSLLGQPEIVRPTSSPSISAPTSPMSRDLN